MQTVTLLALFISQICLLEAAAPIKKAAVTLLSQGSSSSQRSVSAHGGQLGGQPSPLWRAGTPLNPVPHGHLLTNYELHPLNDIACLEAKQRDAAVKCSDVHPGLENKGHFDAGNYPSRTDPRCNNGNGELFCDPNSACDEKIRTCNKGLLTPKERTNITVLQHELRQKQLVTCGPQLQHETVDKWHYMPFSIGVAIAQDWPLHESDSQSLQTAGRIIAGRWNMQGEWNGNPDFYSRCPSEALLIILPDKRQAHLSSSSCQFICEEKGGPEVVLATLLALDSGGIAAAVEAGLRKAYEVVSKTSPMHVDVNGRQLPEWNPKTPTAGTWVDWAQKEPDQSLVPVDQTTMEEDVWNWAQRVIFLFALILLVISLIVALWVCVMAPRMSKELYKNVV